MPAKIRYRFHDIHGQIDRLIRVRSASHVFNLSEGFIHALNVCMLVESKLLLCAGAELDCGGSVCFFTDRELTDDVPDKVHGFLKVPSLDTGTAIDDKEDVCLGLAPWKKEPKINVSPCEH